MNKFFRYAFIATVALSCFGSAYSAQPASQIKIERIEQMPNLPEPYKMRNWKKMAEDYDAFVFDFDRKGEYLPLIRWSKGPSVSKGRIFAMDSFVGWNSEHYETITCLGAVNGASVAGIDKSNQNGQNWVRLCANHFNDKPGINLYLNNSNDKTGRSFWYELFPNILFYRIYDHYPETEKMADQFTLVADGWYEACRGMGGKVEPWTVPDFDHTSYNFLTGKPFDNGIWKEAGSSCAIAWIEYMAYVKTGNKKYLTAARWGMDFVQNAEKSPYYEVLFPHGPYIAARMNAEQGAEYDVEKLVNWCFDGNNKRKWGESIGKWGEKDFSGITASLSGAANGSYAFSMNTFNKANSLVPLVRYDDRFARAIGKWMLNAANSMRLFYSNGLPAGHQTDADWAGKYDPTFCIAYEGMKPVQSAVCRIESNFKTLHGKVKSGTLKDTIFTNKKCQVLEEEVVGDGDRLEHIWKILLPDADSLYLNMLAQVSGKETFQVSYSEDPEGPFVKVCVFDSKKPRGRGGKLKVNGCVLYLKVEDMGKDAGASELDTISVDDVWIRAKGNKSPFATGDSMGNRWARTNFGLYGSSFVGIFGGIIKTTNVRGILQLNCLATDYFRAQAFPTYLYFNHFRAQKEIEIDVGSESKDLYNSVTDSFLKKDVTGKVKFSIPGDTAVLVVVAPAGGDLTQRGSTTLINGVAVDYVRSVE